MSEVSKLPSEESAEKVDKTDKSGDFQILEIDLVEKAEIIWSGRKAIIIITLIFSIIGLFHYSTAPEEFVSNATLIQEIESSGGVEGGGALLRSLTGMNIQTSQGNLSAAARGRAPLPVSLYPMIVNSTDFQKDLIYREIEFSTLDTTMTLYDFFSDHYQAPLRDRTYSFIGDMTIYLPFTIYNATRRYLRNLLNFISRNDDSETESTSTRVVEEIEIDDRLLSITNRERSVIERMRSRISLSVGGGTTEITTTLPDAKAAAIVNAILVERIQDYMTEYRIEKARQNLEAVIRQYEEARERYEEAQKALARFQDENINLSTAMARTQEEHLRDQRNLRYNVYNSIAQEVEQARLVLEQQIPVFNILEKPNIPTTSSAGSSDLILVFSVILGLFFGVGWILFKNSSIMQMKYSNS